MISISNFKSVFKIDGLPILPPVVRFQISLPISIGFKLKNQQAHDMNYLYLFVLFSFVD